MLKKRCGDMQLVVTTHSSFVANKLNLNNLILLNGDESTSFTDLQEDTSRFFMKAPGYNTLRVLLCRASILVEGNADELVVQRAYLDSYGRLPIQDGIDVISVGGTTFLRFLEIAQKNRKKILLSLPIMTGMSKPFEANTRTILLLIRQKPPMPIKSFLMMKAISLRGKRKK